MDIIQVGFNDVKGQPKVSILKTDTNLQILSFEDVINSNDKHIFVHTGFKF